MFAGVSTDRAKLSMGCLDRFLRDSGLGLSNLQSNTNEIITREFFDILGITLAEDLGKYLGAFIFSDRVTKENSQQVVNRKNKRHSK